jgi:hypothetical protein
MVPLSTIARKAAFASPVSRLCRKVRLDASTGGKGSKLVAASTQMIRCVAVETGPSMLIRPDACIAWAGEENSTDGLEEALRRWFSRVMQHLEPANWNEVITRPYGGG